MQEREKRIFGMLAGCALGDAMGMPSEGMDAKTIRTTFGTIRRFLPSCEKDVLGRSFKAGQVTDDTINTLLVCDAVIAGQGSFDPFVYLSLLQTWICENRGQSQYMIGPSTKQALQAIADGIPLEEAGRNGTTNGAAMKAAPLGIISDYKRLDQLIDHVSLLCLPTHHTPVAIAGASIVAALSSYALQGGCDLEEMWGLADRVCSHRKAYDLAAELDDIREYMVRHEKAEILRYLEKKGTGIETIQTIPAVLALLELSGLDPYECAVLAAGLGGDTDTIGAISCSICGAIHLDIDETFVSVLEQVNGIDFSAYARNLSKYGSS